MNILQVRADIAKFQQETMRLAADTEQARRRERWCAPVVTVSAALALGSGVAAIVASLACHLH